MGSLQEQLDVRLVIEEWDGAPPPFGDTWQEEAKCRLYLRGYLSIDEGSAGKAIHGLRLASGVGNYAVRVYASNPEEAAAATRSSTTPTATRSPTSSSRPRSSWKGSSGI